MNKEELQIIFKGMDELTPVAKEISGGLDDLNKEAKNTGKDGFGGLEKMTGVLKGAFVGLAVGGIALVVAGLGAIAVSSFDLSSQVQQSQGQIQAELGVTADEADRLADVALDVFGNNFGESVLDAKNAIVTVRQQLRGLADEDLQSVVEGAFAIKDSFGVEITETTNAVKALMENFGVSSDKALNMIAQGFQAGLNSSDDFLDSITEYSNQFKEGGATADEFFNVLASGLGTGVIGTDKAGDIFKEFVVRIQDGSKLTSESLEAIGIDSKKVLKELANGTIEPIDAFEMVQSALKNTKSEAKQMQAGVGLLGTQFEDLGASTVLAMDISSDMWGENGKALDDLNARYDNFNDFIQGIWREITVAMVPMTDKLLELANDALPYVRQAFEYFTTTVIPMLVEVWNNQLAPALDQIQKFIIEYLWPAIQIFLLPALQSLWGSFMELYNVIQPYLMPILQVLGVIIGVLLISAIMLLSGFIRGLGITFRFFADIARIAITGVKELLDNLKTIGKGVIDFFTGVFTGDWNKAWNGAKDVFKGVWDQIVSIGKSSINTLISGINAVIRAFNSASKVTGGDGLNIPEVPQFAKGGMHSGGLRIVGENGPELEATGASRIFNAKQTAEMLGGGNGGGVTIQKVEVHIGSYMGTEKDKRSVADELADAMIEAIKKRNPKFA